MNWIIVTLMVSAIVTVLVGMFTNSIQTIVGSAVLLVGAAVLYDMRPKHEG